MSSKKLQLNYVSDFELCDRNHFLIIKGISAILALASFILSAYMNISWLTPIRGICTAVFLFCSGYGVAESFQRKRGLIHYWENKMIKIWIPSLVSLIIVSLITKSNFLAWIGSSPIGLKGETLYIIFGGYAAFWLLFYFLENKAVRCIGLFVFAGIAMAFITKQAIIAVLPCFPVGVLFAQYGMKYKIRAMGAGKLFAICAICLVLAVAGWILRGIVENLYVKIFITGVMDLAGALFLLLFVYSAKKVPVFGVFVPFGYMAYGLYLFYDGVLTLLSYAKDVQTYAMVIALLFVIAGVYSWLRELLIIMNKNARRRKSTRLKGSMW